MPAPSSISFLRGQVLALFQAGRTLTVRWDCGGDESFVYTELDGVEQQSNYANDDDLCVLMSDYLTELLNLPDAGDFSMRGTGRIFQERQEIVIDYESELWADDSWMNEMSDEELADIGCTRPASTEKQEDAEPVYEADAEYSGRRVLFSVS